VRDRIAWRAGFTLTEMLIVVAALAALASVAVPLLLGPDPERVELAAVELVQALRFARSEAERTGVPHGVRIDAATEQVQLFRLDLSTMPPTHDFAIYHPVHRGLFVLDYSTDPQTSGVQITAATLTFTAACSELKDLVFDERGTPLCSNPVSVGLTAATINVGNGQTTRLVNVAGVTGRVVLQ